MIVRGNAEQVNSFTFNDAHCIEYTLVNTQNSVNGCNLRFNSDVLHLTATAVDLEC